MNYEPWWEPIVENDYERLLVRRSHVADCVFGSYENLYISYNIRKIVKNPFCVGLKRDW